MSDSRERLEAYYKLLLKNKGMADESTDKKVNYVLETMSEKDIKALSDKVESMDPSYKRLMAYAVAFSKWKSDSEELQPSNSELAEQMDKTIKAYDHYDIDSELREVINGNTFLYQKDFPIDQYRDYLATYGEEEQDEVYSVYVDEEGRLVVY